MRRPRPGFSPPRQRPFALRRIGHAPPILPQWTQGAAASLNATPWGTSRSTIRRTCRGVRRARSRRRLREWTARQWGRTGQRSTRHVKKRPILRLGGARFFNLSPPRCSQSWPRRRRPGRSTPAKKRRRVASQSHTSGRLRFPARAVARARPRRLGRTARACNRVWTCLRALPPAIAAARSACARGAADRPR